MHQARRIRPVHPIPAPRRRAVRGRRNGRPIVAAAWIVLVAALVPAVAVAPAWPAPLPPPRHAILDPGLGPVGGLAAGGLLTRPAPASAELARRFEAALHEGIAAAEAPGATLAVARDGHLVWTGAAGSAGEDAGSLAPESPMVIGSVTKTFIAALVLQLAAEGRLALDDPVSTHLPDLPMMGLDGISLRQLLDHTSGLADVFNDTTRIGLEESPDHAWTADEILATLHEPWFAPGENWAYANTNYLLLTLVAERVGGQRMEDALRARLTEPLGLDDVRPLPVDGVDGPLAAAWRTIFRGSGAMVATAEDLALWGDGLYRGEVLDAASRREMLAFNEHDHGLGAQRLEVGGVEGYGHTGLLNTYTTVLFHAPSEGVTIALLVAEPRAELETILSHRAAGAPSLLDLALSQATDAASRPGWAVPAS